MEFTLNLQIKPPVGKVKNVAIKKNEVIIGRDKSCDIRLTDPEVSRRHACLRVLASDNIIIADMGSSNGTYVKNSPITRETRITPGTIIRMGNSFITVEVKDAFKCEYFQAMIPDTAFVKTDDILGKTVPVNFSDSARFFDCISDLLFHESDRFSPERVLNKVADAMQAYNGVLTMNADLSGVDMVMRAVRQESIHIPEGVIDRIFENGDCFMLCSKPHSDKRDPLRKKGIGSAIGAPGIISGKTLMAVYLTRSIDQVRFTQDDLGVLCHLTQLCAQSLSNDKNQVLITKKLKGLETERQRLFETQTVKSDSRIPGSNKKFQQLLFTAMRVGRSDRHVFICGSQGSGRSFLAQRIHSSSPRSDEPFLSVNCLSLSRNMISEILFGSDDSPDAMGVLEQADGGTLYLREITALPFPVQNRLSEVLRTGFLTKPNGSKKIPVSVRVIVSSNIHPEKPAFEHSFDRELVKLTSSALLSVPPLSEHSEDIIPLAKHFLRQFLPKNRPVPEFHTQAADLLVSYTWPGNIAELRNAMCYTAAACTENDIQIGDLLPSILEVSSSASPKNLNLRQQLDMLETNLIRIALERNRSIVTKAAESLGLSESTLRYRMQRLKITV
jgi:DNA-binding NtrC family response regulator